jgi:type II secretory pathway pseudopilin PulG
MAARESQGFQIALIVFVLLSVILSVTTFVFFRNYQGERLRADSNQAAKAEADSAKNRMQEQRDKYVAYSGLPAPSGDEKKATEDAVKDATDAWTKDMNAASPLLGGTAEKPLPDDQKTYKKIVDGLQGVIRAKDATNQKLAADLRDAKTLYETKTADYEKQKQDLAAKTEQAVADYMAERKKIDDLNQELNDSKTQMAAEMAKNEKSAEAQKSDLQGKIAKLDDSLKKMQTQMQLKSADLDKLSGKFDVNAKPNGKIVWVNQSQNLAYIDLGSDDHLRKRINFSVYDPSTTDVSAIKSKQAAEASSETGTTKSGTEAKSKGTIEVINITGPHMAVCRIVENPNTTPILPDDLIFTPVWRAGEREHFALLGVMDLDGDGTDDRARIHDIIHQSGGVIDAEVDEKGNLQGEITYETRYLVKGKNDVHENVSRAGSDKLLNQADKMGVESIDLAKFLDMMGYISVAAENRVAEAAVLQPPVAGTPDSNFRARTPPATRIPNARRD